MASMPRTAIPPLLLLLSLSAAAAAPAVRPTGGAAVAKVCEGTGTLKECVETINANPDREPPRRQAELAYAYLVKDGEALYKEAQAAVAAAATMKPADQNCAAAMQSNMKYYYESVSRFAPEESKERFDQAKNNLDDLLRFPSDTGTWSCDVPIVGKVAYYEILQQATLGLMKNVDAPPPEKKAEEPAKSVKEPAP